MTVYEADWVCPVSTPPVRNARIAVENGRIVGNRNSEENVVRFPGCAIIPGFINAHSHIELTILRGYLDHLPFTDWIPRLTNAMAGGVLGAAYLAGLKASTRAALSHACSHLIRRSCG